MTCEASLRFICLCNLESYLSCNQFVFVITFSASFMAATILTHKVTDMNCTSLDNMHI